MSACLSVLYSTDGQQCALSGVEIMTSYKRSRQQEEYRSLAHRAAVVVRSSVSKGGLTKAITQTDNESNDANYTEIGQQPNLHKS